MDKSRVSLAISSFIEMVEMVAGFGWGAFCTLATLLLIFDDKSNDDIAVITVVIIVMGLFAAFGFWVFSWGRKRRNMRLTFKRYVVQLNADPFNSLEDLATATNSSVDIVKKNLQYMIKKNFFVDAFINEQTNQLVLPSMASRVQQQAQAPQTSKDADQQELVTVVCPCCGGRNEMVKGTTKECDFCGSPLSAK